MSFHLAAHSQVTCVLSSEKKKKPHCSENSQAVNKEGLPTCAKSIIARVHLIKIGIDGGALSRVVCAVQTAMTDCVEITAVWRETAHKKPSVNWCSLLQMQEMTLKRSASI